MMSGSGEAHFGPERLELGKIEPLVVISVQQLEPTGRCSSKFSGGHPMVEVSVRGSHGLRNVQQSEPSGALEPYQRIVRCRAIPATTLGRLGLRAAAGAGVDALPRPPDPRRPADLDFRRDDSFVPMDLVEPDLAVMIGIEGTKETRAVIREFEER